MAFDYLCWFFYLSARPPNFVFVSLLQLDVGLSRFAVLGKAVVDFGYSFLAVRGADKPWSIVLLALPSKEGKPITRSDTFSVDMLN